MNKIEMHNVYSYLWSLAETFEINTMKKRGNDQEMQQKICMTVLIKLQCNTGSILGQWFQWDFDEECHTPVFFQDAVLHNYLNLYLPFHALPYQPLPSKRPGNKVLDTVMKIIALML